jgi:hypothetical protein
MFLGLFESYYLGPPKSNFVDGKTSLNLFFAGLHKFQNAMDWRPDCGCGLDWSSYFLVLTGYGPVQSHFFSSLVTGLLNTNCKAKEGI